MISVQEFILVQKRTLNFFKVLDKEERIKKSIEKEREREKEDLEISESAPKG